MVLISLILLTILYYFLLAYIQRRRQIAFQKAALDVIGPTKQLEIPISDQESIFGVTSTSSQDLQLSVQEKDNTIKTPEQIERTAIFGTTTSKEESKFLDHSKELTKDIAQADTDTDTEIQQEAISDLNTKEELNLIATELGYEETSDELSLTEEGDLEQMMKVLDGFPGLYDQEVQEVIGNNTQSTS